MKLRVQMFYPIMLILIMVVIFVLSAQDGDVSADISEDFASSVGITSVDTRYSASARPLVVGLSIRKFAHIGLFALLGLFAYLTVMNSRWQLIAKLTYWKKVICILLFCYLYGCLDELHQCFVVGRNGNFMDTWIDFLGFGIMTALLVINKSWHKTK